MPNFNKQLKMLRQESGLSQQEFAKRIGMSKSSVNMYERGEREPGIETLECIADYFNVDMDFLLGKSDIRKKRTVPKTSMMIIGEHENKRTAERIKHYRRKRHLTEEQFAELLEVDKIVVENIESGEYRLQDKMMFKICDVLQLDPFDIIDYDPETIDTNTEYLLDRQNRYGIDSLHDAHKIPLIEKVVQDDPITYWENIGGEYNCPNNFFADFCIKCSDESMSGANIHEGDIIYIHQQPEVENGEIAAVLIEEDIAIRRVFKKEKAVILQSENSLFMPLVLDSDDMEDIRVLGKAVCVLSKVR